MLQNIVGPPARGESFFNREEFIESLWKRLEANNVLLAAPRRFGKTSVMYKLIDAPRPGWKPVHLDAESIREPVNFVIALLEALLADKKLRKVLVSGWRKTTGFLRDLLDEVELTTPVDVGVKLRIKTAIGPDWQDRAESLLSTLKSYGENERLLIVIDELPVMLYLFQDNNVSDADTRAFLYWFRRMRTDPGVGLTNCRFLVGGSIGIERYLSQLGCSDSINDFQPVVLPQLTPEQASGFLDALLECQELDLDEEARAKLLALVGTPIPFFLQVFVAQLGIARDQGLLPGVRPKNLEEFYQHDVLSASFKSYFQHYYDRLRHYDTPEGTAAKVLLKELALAQEDGVRRSHLLQTYREALRESGTDEGFAGLIDDLENDFYVRYRVQDESYVFASKILRDWWRRHYAF